MERHVGLEGGKGFTNSVTQVELAENAKLTHVHLQAEAPQAFHVGRMLVQPSGQ